MVVIFLRTRDKSLDFTNIFITSILQGHKLPAGMTIHADIHYVMWNDPHFVDPKEFLPERYISADGKSLRKVEDHSSTMFLPSSQDTHFWTVPLQAWFYFFSTRSSYCISGLSGPHHPLLHWPSIVRGWGIGANRAIPRPHSNDTALSNPADAWPQDRPHAAGPVHWRTEGSRADTRTCVAICVLYCKQWTW